MTTDLSRNSLEKQADFHERVSDYLQHPTWSIAFGALLLSNVLPPARCTKIPEEASCLYDKTAAATFRQLGHARKVMRAWVDGFDEEELADDVPQETTPHEFLEWASENLDHDPQWAPPLLSYFTSLVRPGVDMVLPEEVIRRLVTLDGQKSSPLDGGQRAAISNSFVNGKTISNRIYGLIEDCLLRAPIASDIARALARLSDNPSAIWIPALVWNELIAMAKSGEKGLSVRYSEDHFLEYLDEGKWVPYLRDRLSQSLKRIREKLEAQSQSE